MPWRGLARWENADVTRRYLSSGLLLRDAAGTVRLNTFEGPGERVIVPLILSQKLPPSFSIRLFHRFRLIDCFLEVIAIC